jgi:hypothetical protein
MSGREERIGPRQGSWDLIWIWGLVIGLLRDDLLFHGKHSDDGRSDKLHYLPAAVIRDRNGFGCGRSRAGDLEHSPTRLFRLCVHCHHLRLGHLVNLLDRL